MLPPEILEMIFSLLPITDLFNVCRVCKNFNEIISRPTFLRYKKRYYMFRFKADCDEDVAKELKNEVEAELEPYNQTEEEENVQHYIQVQNIACASTVNRFEIHSSLRRTVFLKSQRVVRGTYTRGSSKHDLLYYVGH